MAGQSQDQFEVYFRRADLDGDGRISGAEAVAFFQGSGLSKQVLAQIWMHADQSHSGFLSKQEFINALKLVTVAQRRELTPDIVKAALYGPAAAKIPAPQINFPPTSAPQMGAAVPTSSSNLGFRGLGVPNASMSQQNFPSQQIPSMRPAQTMPAATAPRPPQGIASPEFFRGRSIVGQPQAMPASSTARPLQPMPTGATGPSFTNQNMSSDWLAGRTGGASTGPRGVTPSTPSATTKPQTAFSMSSQPTANDSKALVVPGNGFASDSAFGGDAFSATSSAPKQELSAQTFSPGSAPTSSGITPFSSVAQPIVKSNSLDSLQSAFSMHSAGSQSQRAYSSLTSAPQVSPSSSSPVTPSGISVGAVNAASNISQLPWPKMKPSDVQKYTKVFMEVDTDRDGKITGEQARNLFLSWRLPREVLKQVWDLSDQDSDSMLSLREFCFALYLMERYREGCPLPSALPSNVMFDETLLSMTGQPNVSYGNAAWGPNPGISFGQQPGLGAQAMTPSTGFRPSIPSNASSDSTTMPNQQKSRAPELDDSFATQIDNSEQNSVNGAAQDAIGDGKKVDGTEKVILDSKEKLEFYREKMQELVLYKSRCDNRLNEIMERAIADKREAEMLAKKYEEKYKQVAEIASKLTIEEAKFREIQERRTELHQAIVNMEQGGSADGILQVRADRLQSDLEELMKALTERCKKHGYDVKSTAVIEFPIGWQPGVPEGAALWDEEWDKFEDEGFGNELTVDVKNVPVSQRGKASPDGSLTPDSSSYVDDKTGNLFSASEHALESESAYTHSEDESARSPRGSPAGRNSLESPSQQFSDDHFGKSTEADAETHRFDESAWGTFDNDDTDSVWGFNPVNTKDSDSEKHRDFFGSSDFGVQPTRTESPSAESFYDKKSPFTFEDSVPSTPHSKFGNSPARFSEASRDQFDSFSTFDSFSMHDSGFSQQPDRLTRFDSINSGRNFGSGFSQQPETLTRFDSINSTKDFGHGFSFDDSDPFGSSGPFKVSSDHQSPKKGSDEWSAF
ncbi:epidermal growth factor receptor substrate 15 isoform X2 [Durio zibethinus]|uniref:Epidermal growth factor receptor substrate 15 isoform X2 n=1 Tax=Durio zibethinus TaxID=66656 RepID=A0A6P6AWV8_DURZI|nr:epidermal growth factor receptor substrate 15 isoform X2 [Durio zibethinus]